MEKRALSGVEPPVADPQDIEFDLDVKQLTESLRYHVAQLPEHLRSVILLRDFGEQSYGEVARILDISVGTARVYRCKAVQLLAMWMNKEADR
jgi:RNA polymerase sigma-70 factor (ECF subfamily)